MAVVCNRKSVGSNMVDAAWDIGRLGYASFLIASLSERASMYHAWQRDDASVIEINNDLDIVSSPALTAAIDIAAQSDQAIVVSLEHCTFCDSSGLGVLLAAKKRLGAKLLVVVPRPKRKLFDITGLTGYLAVADNVTQALAMSIDAA